MKGIFQRTFYSVAFGIAFLLIGVLLVLSGKIILGPLANSFINNTNEVVGTNPNSAFATLQNIDLKKWKGSIPPTDDEFVGPFSSWLDVKTGFGAKGDGVTDDTGALQAAFDAVAKGNKGATLYLPPGVYLITNTLTLNHYIFISIVGADPNKTIIKWGGAAHGTMMNNNGTAYSKFDRITWNGAGIADVAVDQSWDGKTPHFDTSNEYADDVFTDVAIGIRGGALGHGFAEISILRDQFIRNTEFGVSLGNFNALDVWIRNSIFEDCATGVTNTRGAGNFRLYNNIFRNSTNSDISMNNTGGFSIRGNTSINSNQFFYAGYSSNPCVNIFTDNVIIDPISKLAVNISNQGPTLFINNTVRSRASVTDGPIVKFQGTHHAELVSFGNKFTVKYAVSATDTKILYGNIVASLASLQDFKEPMLPGVEPNFNRKIFEVPPGADAAAIQAVIDEAEKAAGKRPVVHFPYGVYKIASTLLIPPGSDMQLVGDGYGEYNVTMLKWSGTGTGPIISIGGPSKATLRDLTLSGTATTNELLITNADQKGARIFLQEVNEKSGQIGMLVNQLDNTILFAYDTQFSDLKKAISVIGGPLAAEGNPAEGRTIIYSGAESNNSLSHEVTKGGNLLVQDTWYEGGIKSNYANLTGDAIFTAAGDHISIRQNTEVPAVSITNFTGRASFLGDIFSDRFSINGDNSRSRLLAIGLLSENNPFVADTSASKADMRMLLNRTRNHNSAKTGTGSDSIPDIGVYDNLFLADMMANMLNVHPIVLAPTPAGVSDIRLYRVMLVNGARAIDIEAGNSIPNNNPIAFAGNNKLVTLPISESILSGSAVDPDGKIAGYKWTKVSGPADATIVSPTTANSKITGLSSKGTYVFRLTVTDDSGAAASSDTKVIVAGS